MGGADPQPLRPVGLRHLLLALSLVVVALSIIGMHQLSVGHTVATGPTSSPLSATSYSPHDHAMAMAMAEVDHPDGHSVAAGTAGTDSAADDPCAGCGEHQMLMGTCLLTLSLLVVSWLLALPRLRLLPPFLLPRLPTAVTRPVLDRVVPPLSLTELSLRRT